MDGAALGAQLFRHWQRGGADVPDLLFPVGYYRAEGVHAKLQPVFFKTDASYVAGNVMPLSFFDSKLIIHDSLEKYPGTNHVRKTETADD